MKRKRDYCVSGTVPNDFAVLPHVILKSNSVK